MDAGNWITLLLGLGTLTLGAVNAYSQWPKHSDGQKASTTRPMIIMGLMTALVVGAVAYDVYDRSRRVYRDSIISWGVAADSYHMVVATSELQSLTKTHRLMLLIRPNIFGVDPINDTNVAKSGLYTISGSTVALAIPVNTTLRMAPNQLNFMEYNAVLLPVGIAPERIHNLGDVVDLGGRIFQNRASSVMAGPPIEPSASPSK